MINFPNSPTLNQTYSYGGKTWKWNGVGWESVAVGLTVDDIPDLPASKITSGTLTVPRGGTGIASYTTGNYIRASAATTLEQRTPAQVLSDIGAAASGHNHTLDSLSNVTITSNSNGEILRWNGTAWVNNTLAEAGIQPAGSYLTGNQTITLSGDLSGSGATSISATIANSAVTLAKMANVATGTVFYRKTAGTGAPEVQTLATLKTDLGLTGTNSGDQTITLTGDITGSGTGSFAATISNNAVTLAKLADITTASILGRVTAGTGDPEVLTAAQVRTLLNVADGATANVGTVTSVAAGNGLNFTTITSSGSVTLGTPSSVTLASTNSVTTNSHTHAFAPGGTTAQYIRGDGTLATFPTVPTTLDSLTNVTITSNTNGEILRWNGTAWVNNTLSEAGIQPAGSYLTGNQTITLSGDLSGSGATAISATIANNAVTLAKLADIATGSILGRVTAATGDPEVLTPAQVRTLLNVADGATANAGTVTSVAAGNGLNFTTITGSGSVTLGTPSSVTLASTNSVTTNSHTHAFAPGGTTAQYIRGDGSLATFPTIPSGTVTSVSAGNGMLFTTITGSGAVTLGTPSTLTPSTTNSATSNSHTHAITGFAPLTAPTFLGPVKIDGAFDGGSTEVTYYAGDWAQMSSDGTGRGVVGRNVTLTRSDNTMRYAVTHGSLGAEGIEFGGGSGFRYFTTFGGATTAGASFTPTYYNIFHSGNLPGTSITWTANQTFNERLQVGKSFRSIGVDDFPSGAGLELYYDPAADSSNGAGFLVSLNRTGTVWKKLQIFGSQIEFYPSGNYRFGVLADGPYDEYGHLRDIPQNIRNAAYTFALTDRGGHVIKTNTTAYTWTIPLNSSVAFPLGTAILVVNDSGTGNVTIARASGVALLDGATNANYTLATNTARTLLKVGTDRWRVL